LRIHAQGVVPDLPWTDEEFPGDQVAESRRLARAARAIQPAERRATARPTSPMANITIPARIDVTGSVASSTTILAGIVMFTIGLVGRAVALRSEG